MHPPLTGCKHTGDRRTVKLNPSEKSIPPTPTHSPRRFAQTNRRQAASKSNSAGKNPSRLHLRIPLAVLRKHAGGRRAVKLTPPEKSIASAPTHLLRRFAHANRRQADGKINSIRKIYPTRPNAFLSLRFAPNKPESGRQ